jgi:hypothetical protein
MTPAALRRRSRSCAGRVWLLLGVGVAFLTQLATPVAAENEWAVTLLGGQYSGSRLLELGGGLDLHDSYTAGIAGSFELAEWGAHLRWEVEAQAIKHFGIQQHVEFTTSINARWVTFPWNRYLDTSVAAGEGLSVASEVPVLEKRDPDNRDAAALLNYVLLEAEVGPPGSPWHLVGRIHHRSGVFGVFSRSGSNVLAVGVRYRF